MASRFRNVAPRGFTVRAMVIGTVLSIFLNLACPLISAFYGFTKLTMRPLEEGDDKDHTPRESGLANR